MRVHARYRSTRQRDSRASLLAGSLHTVALYASMRLAPSLFVFTLLALTVTSRPVSLVNIFNESVSFSSDCSLNSTLTVKHDQQFGNLTCTFYFEEGLPSGARYKQTTDVVNATVPIFNCQADRKTCFAETRVENRVNCSFGFVGQDSRYSSCFNYSIYVGHNISPGTTEPTGTTEGTGTTEPPERNRDLTWWIIGLVITMIVGVGAWAFTIGVLCKRMRTKECDMNDKLNNELNDLKGKFNIQMNELSDKFEHHLKRIDQSFNASLQTERDSHRREQEKLQMEMNKKIEDLKIQYEKDQEDLKMRFSATQPSPPLNRSGSNSASMPQKLSDKGKDERAVTVGYGVRSAIRRPYGRQLSDPISEHGSTGDAAGHTALTRYEFEHNPAGDHSRDSFFDDPTVSFKAGISESDSD